MAYSYDEMQGSPTDPQDHPADSGHNNDQYAGDVVSLGAARSGADIIRSFNMKNEAPNYGTASDRTNIIPLAKRPK